MDDLTQDILPHIYIPLIFINFYYLSYVFRLLQTLTNSFASSGICFNRPVKVISFALIL